MLEAGGKVLSCGKGGSVADAQHFAAELVGTYLEPRRQLAAFGLTTNSSVLTCLPYDYGYDRVLASQVAVLGRPGDLLLAISTS